MLIKISTSVAPKGRVIYANNEQVLELLTGAIGSPQGPAHYNVMSRVFNKASKNDFALAPKCHDACWQ